MFRGFTFVKYSGVHGKISSSLFIGSFYPVSFQSPFPVGLKTTRRKEKGKQKGIYI
jgi:hypothetical protein